jgi:hypothetical protein
MVAAHEASAWRRLAAQRLGAKIRSLPKFLATVLMSRSTITAAGCGAHRARAVWIVTSFRLRTRMHKHANAWWSLQISACTNDVTAYPCLRAQAAREHDGTQALQAHGELAPRAQPAQRSPEDPLQVEWLNLQALNTSDTMYITIVAISRPLSHKTAGATQAAVQRVDIIELEATGRAAFPRMRWRLCSEPVRQKEHAAKSSSATADQPVYARRPRGRFPGPHRAPAHIVLLGAVVGCARSPAADESPLGHPHAVPAAYAVKMKPNPPKMGKFCQNSQIPGDKNAVGARGVGHGSGWSAAGRSKRHRQFMTI